MQSRSREIARLQRDLVDLVEREEHLVPGAGVRCGSEVEGLGRGREKGLRGRGLVPCEGALRTGQGGYSVGQSR